MATLRKLAAWRVGVAAGAVAVALSLGGCPPQPNGNGTLEGAWAGDVTYLAGLKLDDGDPQGQPFEKSFTITFDTSGQPDNLDLVIGNANEVLLLQTDDLMAVGDSTEQTFTRTSGSSGVATTTNVTAAVTSISRTETSYTISLDLTVEIVGSGTMAGTYSATATVQDNDTLAWSGNTDLHIALGNDGPSLDLVVTTTGALSRQ